MPHPKSVKFAQTRDQAVQMTFWKSMSLESSQLCEKFVNFIMHDGKKLGATKQYIQTLEIFNRKLGTSSLKSQKSWGVQEKHSILEHLTRAVENCMPTVEIRKVRVAGTTYLVPKLLEKKKQTSLAIRWIVEAATLKKKSTHLSFAFCLADQLVECLYHQGYAVTKRNQLHSLAEANRASLRYRWW